MKMYYVFLTAALSHLKSCRKLTFPIFIWSISRMLVFICCHLHVSICNDIINCRVQAIAFSHLKEKLIIVGSLTVGHVCQAHTCLR